MISLRHVCCGCFHKRQYVNRLGVLDKADLSVNLLIDYQRDTVVLKTHTYISLVVTSARWTGCPRG